MELEIQNVHNRANAAIHEKAQGQGRVNTALLELDTLTQTLNTIEKEIDELVKQVALANPRG